MRGLNKVTLIGNLGKDPELQELKGNISVVKVSLATTELYKDRNRQSHAETERHTVVLWRSLAELAANYLHKGSLVYLEGKLKTRHLEDKEGRTRYVTEIVADHLNMLDKRTNDTTPERSDTPA